MYKSLDILRQSVRILNYIRLIFMEFMNDFEQEQWIFPWNLQVWNWWRCSKTFRMIILGFLVPLLVAYPNRSSNENNSDSTNDSTSSLSSDSMGVRNDDILSSYGSPNSSGLTTDTEVSSTNSRGFVGRQIQLEALPLKYLQHRRGQIEPHFKEQVFLEVILGVQVPCRRTIVHRIMWWVRGSITHQYSTGTHICRSVAQTELASSIMLITKRIRSAEEEQYCWTRVEVWMRAISIHFERIYLTLCLPRPSHLPLQLMGYVRQTHLCFGHVVKVRTITLNKKRHSSKPFSILICPLSLGKISLDDGIGRRTWSEWWKSHLFVINISSETSEM